jgi:hypothetical protein
LVQIVIRYVEGIQICSNKRPGPVQREKNYKNRLSSLTTCPEKLKFTRQLPHIVKIKGIGSILFLKNGWIKISRKKKTIKIILEVIIMRYAQL